MTEEITNATYRVLYQLLSAWLHDEGMGAAVPNDWNAFLKAADRQSISAAVCMALEKTNLLSQCPPEIASRFQEAKVRSIRRTLLMDAERKKLLAFLEENAIWYMPLKGILLQRLYPQLGAREFADNDILFDAERWESVRDYMNREGYKTKNIIMFSHDTYHKPPLYNFEMHRRLFSEGINSVFLHTCADYYAGVRQRLIKDESNGFGYHFSDEDFYIYYLAHAYGHYEQSGTGVRMLLDLFVYRRAKPEMDETYIEEQLTKLGILKFERTCRSLAEKLFGWPYQYDQLVDNERKLLSKLENFGTYGKLSNKVYNAFERIQQDGKPIVWQTKFKYLWRQIFPNLQWYQENVPFCYRNRWAIPFFWVYRLFWIVTAGRKQGMQELKAIFSASSDPDPFYDD